MYLGLDISSSITGIAILDKQGNIIHNSVCDTRKYKNFWDKVRKAHSVLLEIKDKYDIKNIYIEQNLQTFRSGFSKAETILTLAKFNGILSWICVELFNIEPQYISVLTARKIYGIKIPKGIKGNDTKKYISEIVEQREEFFTIEYTKYGNPKPGIYDKADSIIIAKAGWKQSLK